jgi:hypothetical protein
MSLNLIRQNSQSPFRLQRSIVDQGGEGGAYESGGFTGESQYNDGGAAAISSFGNTIAAGLSSITPGDKNKMNEKKVTRLEKRSTKIEAKQKSATESGNTNRANRLKKRNTRVENRLGNTKKEIEDYKKSKNLTLKSSVNSVKPNINSNTNSDISDTEDYTDFE